MKKLWPFKQCQKYMKYLQDHNYPLDWEFICKDYKLPISFIRKHLNEINWRQFSAHQKMNSKFIREFKDYIVWDVIQFEHLSENERREFGLTKEMIKKIIFQRNYGVW